MSSYIISYDLHKDRNYAKLWAELKAAGAVKILESLWLLETDYSAIQVSSALRNLVDNDDSFVMIELIPGASWSSCNVPPQASDWLQRHIRTY